MKKKIALKDKKALRKQINGKFTNKDSSGSGLEYRD
jgi:hypothetical protein